MKYQEAGIKSEPELLRELNSKTDGLLDSQIEKQRSLFGKNLLSAHQVSSLEIFLNQFRSSFVYLLLLASALSFFLGERIDGFIIILFVSINATLGFWQEFKVSSSLKKLRALVTKTSNVFRAGHQVTVSDSEIVVGDLIVLKAGDQIPADIRFFETSNLTVDESLLSGESVPVLKSEKTLEAEPRSIEESTNIGFSGTLVTSGQAHGLVFAVGNQTQLGLLGKLAVETESESGFNRETNKLSRDIIILVFATLVGVLLLHLLVKPGPLSLGELAVFSIALAVGVVPEALPLVVTISLSAGALRLAAKKVVPRRLSAIEDLGGIEILCTDKTGTITENNLQLQDVFPQRSPEILKYALWSTSEPEKKEESLEPFDRSIWQAADSSTVYRLSEVKRLGELPFDPERRRNSVLVELDDQLEIIIRGAPEEVIGLCSDVPPLLREQIAVWLEEAGRRGQRVLALAVKKLKTLPADLKIEEENLNFIGLISFADSLKKSARSAIAQAEMLGLRVKILSGDSLAVSQNVGLEIGLIKENSEAMAGGDYRLLNELQKNEAVEKIDVFARVSPEDKFDIVKRLQRRHLVGYLGEGFNDVPVLKEANVSLVVDNASDIAKDSADVVLLSKDLLTIIDGIKEGRKTFVNTLKYIRATLTSNFGNFFALAFSSLFINYLPMLPIQILLTNLLTDFPLISVSTDNVSEAAITKPKKYEVKRMILLAVLLGTVSTVFDFLTFGLFVSMGQRVLQTLWFTESVLTEIVLVFSIRSGTLFLKAVRPSSWIILLSLITVAITFVVIFSSLGRQFFGFTVPSLGQLSMVLAIVAVYFAVSELVKIFYYRRVGEE